MLDPSQFSTNATGNVAFCMAISMDQFLANVESLTCGGSLCIRNRALYCVSRFNGGCTALCGMMMDSCSNDGDLAGAGLISIFIPVNLIRQQSLDEVLYKSNSHNLISSHNFPPYFIILVVDVFNVSICDSPGADHISWPLAII